MTNNLAEDVSITRLADISGLSPSYFRQAFKATTGLAPHQWLIQARCARAKQLLLEGRLALAEIALEVGFCDQAHFTRSFVRIVGASPGAWRRERGSQATA
jgi:AraC family transcriptional regulator